MMPLVSVIIPVYNVQLFLREALDSVVTQTYHNIEIIVIDDGSDDGSEIICDEYQEKDSRVCVIHQKNHGLSTARNAGLDIVSGEYIAFLDSDDAYHPDMIQKMLKAMARWGADIAISGISSYDTMQQMKIASRFTLCDFLQEEITEPSKALAEMMEGKLSWCVWNKLYDANLWETIRFPDGHVYEDACTTYRIFQRADCVVKVPGCSVRRRVRPGSISHTKSFQNSCDWVRACQQMEAFVEENTPFVLSHLHPWWVTEA